MNKNQQIFLELIIVLALVVFGLWSLKKNSDPAPTGVDNIESVEGS